MGKEQKPKTQTTPKGTVIPVPKRGEFLRDLRKVSEPQPQESKRAASPSVGDGPPK